MIHITLTRSKPSPPNDPLGRRRYGYAPEMTPIEIYAANHGYYALGTRADAERYALFSAPGENGTNFVVLAVEISEIVPVLGMPGRRVINGEVLREGHPVYDTYVGKPAPVSGVRNPVTYINSPFD